MMRGMTNTAWGLVAAAGAGLALFSAAARAQQPGDAILTMSRQAPAEVPPDGELSITITIARARAGTLQALGVLETPPSGWAYAGLGEAAGPLPSVQPVPGDTGVLSFAWIAPPDFPYSFSYLLSVPSSELGLKTLTGHVEYRGAGAALQSATVTSQIAVVDTPVITLYGDNPLSLEQGIPYIEPGFVALDSPDGDLTDRVEVLGYVDFLTPGEYVLTYTVTDAEDNTAQVQRTVFIEAVPDKRPVACGPRTASARPGSAGDALLIAGMTVALLAWVRRPHRKHPF